MGCARRCACVCEDDDMYLWMVCVVLELLVVVMMVLGGVVGGRCNCVRPVPGRIVLHGNG